MDTRYHEFYDLFYKEEYYDCHEVLEHIWIDETACKTKNHNAVVLLQYAVALYHWKNKNERGSTLLLESTLHRSKEVVLEEVGILHHSFIELVDHTLKEVKKGKEYHKVILPMKEVVL